MSECLSLPTRLTASRRPKYSPLVAFSGRTGQAGGISGLKNSKKGRENAVFNLPLLRWNVELDLLLAMRPRLRGVQARGRGRGRGRGSRDLKGHRGHDEVGEPVRVQVGPGEEQAEESREGPGKVESSRQLGGEFLFFVFFFRESFQFNFLF